MAMRNLIDLVSGWEDMVLAPINIIIFHCYKIISHYNLHTVLARLLTKISPLYYILINLIYYDLFKAEFISVIYRN